MKLMKFTDKLTIGILVLSLIGPMAGIVVGN